MPLDPYPAKQLLRLPKALHDELVKAAKKEDLRMSQAIRQAIKMWLKSKEKSA